MLKTVNQSGAVALSCFGGITGGTCPIGENEDGIAVLVLLIG